jgi:23S rRNA (uracil1939-C5)-methyltransferase
VFILGEQDIHFAMTVKKGQVLEIAVTDIAFGGRGLARINGLAVFIDQAVPLDRVLARIVRKKKNYAEANLVELIEPSPDRVEAPCPYSGVCGGCKWQFLAYPKQLAYKQRHVVEALEHIALVRGVPVHSAIASDQIFGYRNKMEFTCSDRRWLMPQELGQGLADLQPALGLHVPGTFYKVLDIRACLLQPAEGNRILNTVQAYLKESRLPVYGLHSHVGFWRFLMLRHSWDRNQWMVNLITAAEDRREIQPLAEWLLRDFPSITSVVNNITDRPAGVAIGQQELLLAGQSTIIDRIGSFEFEISANSFFQTNTRGALRLYDVVKNYAELSGTETVIDLYSGTGTIAIYLAAAAREVIGMEMNAGAVADAKKNCLRNRIANCRFIHGDVKTSLAQFDGRPEVMIIDPPRDGMHKEVVRQVMELAPPKIVYVSCNPATMARDMLLLKEAYAIAEVQPVDMFPHTFHIESVAKLARK